jgi:CheY-like chemotaxis protein
MARAVLIADDDEDDAVALSATLKKAGVKNPLFAVNDGAEVIAYLKGDRRYSDREKFPLPAVLLLDLKMPRIGGLQVLQWLAERQQVREILIIVLTGHNDMGNLRTAYQTGARSFLTKPCRLVDVQNLIRSYSTYWESDVPPIERPSM